ncbi:ATP-binding protein [Streptomyces sp. NPDC004296]|uniref:ATP-binding protein n=1 Tax=Streptomyces sp. NPDC004296 TaxID=3364697 RepID=UPI0036A070CF
MPTERADRPAQTAVRQDAPPSAGVVIAVSLAAEPSLVPDVRHSLRAVVLMWGSLELADQLELLASELVSNAVRHGGGDDVTVLLKVQGGSALLEVTDHSGTEPIPRSAGADDEGGRGLALVGLLADVWGWYPAPRGRKTVWAGLALSKAGDAA